jgi:isocitrate dehydrogenase
LGFASSGNYGDEVAIFEAVHGSAPKYAGKNVINPTALILSAVMMLDHLGESATARRIEDAVHVTLEAGAVTLDVARATGDVEHATSTSGFADAIIGNLGKQPENRYPTRAGARTGEVPAPRRRWSYGAARAVDTAIHGVDIYVEADLEPEALGGLMETAAGPDFQLELISTRGTLVHPPTGGRMQSVAWWCCRFIPASGDPTDDAAIGGLLGRVGAQVTWTQVQKLRRYAGVEGFTRAQG